MENADDNSSDRLTGEATSANTLTGLVVALGVAGALVMLAVAALTQAFQ